MKLIKEVYQVGFILNSYEELNQVITEIKELNDAGIKTKCSVCERHFKEYSGRRKIYQIGKRLYKDIFNLYERTSPGEFTGNGFYFICKIELGNSPYTIRAGAPAPTRYLSFLPVSPNQSSEKANQEAFSRSTNNAPPALEPASLNGDKLVKDGKLIYRRNKQSMLRNKINDLSKPEKKTISSLMKKKKRRNPASNNHNSLSQVTEKILSEIMELHWFVTHRKSSQSYKKSFDLVQKHYRRFRSSLVGIFKLGNDYFSNPRFVYRPRKKLTVHEFFKYHEEDINRSKALQKIGVKSWFDEFAKGRENIEQNFVKRRKDRHPEITREAEKIWLGFTKAPDIKPHERDNLVVFVEKCFAFRDANQPRIKSARDIVSILKDIILSDPHTHVKNTNYILTDYFWRNTVPDALRKWGMFTTNERINLI